MTPEENTEESTPEGVQLAIDMVDEALPLEGPGMNDIFNANLRLRQEFRTVGELFMATSTVCSFVNFALLIIIGVLIYGWWHSESPAECMSLVTATQERVAVLEYQMAQLLETLNHTLPAIQ